MVDIMEEDFKKEGQPGFMVLIFGFRRGTKQDKTFSVILSSEIFFVRPMEIFVGQIFFISLLIKATEGIFLVMVYSSSLMIPSFIHVKKSDKTQGDILIRGGYLKTKIIKEGLLQAGCSCLG